MLNENSQFKLEAPQDEACPEVLGFDKEDMFLAVDGPVFLDTSVSCNNLQLQCF